MCIICLLQMPAVHQGLGTNRHPTESKYRIRPTMNFSYLVVSKGIVFHLSSSLYKAQFESATVETSLLPAGIFVGEFPRMNTTTTYQIYAVQCYLPFGIEVR